jgi:Cu-Zn family superoxide dismutase
MAHPLMHHPVRTAAALVAAFVVSSISACGGGTPPPAPPSAPQNPPMEDPAMAAFDAEPAPVPAAETPAPAAAPAAAAPITVKLEARSGSKLTGQAVLTETATGVKVEMTVENGGTPGPHGTHVHEKGDCSAPDGTSAGGHFNPDGVDHGQISADPHHAGDSNNITADADGKATVDRMLSANVDIGKGDKYDILGKAVIVHEKADDYKTQPTGDAGGRLACGVIEAAAAM